MFPVQPSFRVNKVRTDLKKPTLRTSDLEIFPVNVQRVDQSRNNEKVGISGDLQIIPL